MGFKGLIYPINKGCIVLFGRLSATMDANNSSRNVLGQSIVIYFLRTLPTRNINYRFINNVDYDALLAMVDLGEHRNQNVGGLSGGQKRRLSLLLTILNSPKLIFLDEPTTGMDLESVDNFWKLLDEQKFTSVIVTHDFNQIDHFFTKVLILKDGRIAASDAVDKIHADGKTIEQYYRENVEKEA